MAGHTRLIIHTDSMKTADVHTFKSAAITVVKAYKTKYPRDSVTVGFVRSGKDIVQQINSIGVGKLITLDIISHGNQGGIHIARKLTKPEKSGFIQRNAHFRMRRHSDNPMH